MRFVRFVLVGAALASIATSQLSAQVVTTAPLPAATVDDNQPMQVYAIDLDRTGPVTSPLSGALTASLELTAASGPALSSAHLDITLRAPDGTTETAAVDIGAGTLALPVRLELPVWSDCHKRSPCRETYTLEITRRDATDDPVVTVTGTLEADAVNIGDDAEPEIALGVTLL